MLARRIVPINKSGLLFLRWIDPPNGLVLVDADDPSALHIYRVALDDEYIPMVISAFSRHYAFDRFATDEETEAWLGDRMKFKKGCNAIGSELQN
jgi:hypothetical protein